MRRNPFPAYEQMRSQSPVLHVPPLDLWMIFDYDGVKRALNDHEAFGSSMFTAKRAYLSASNQTGEPLLRLEANFVRA